MLQISVKLKFQWVRFEEKHCFLLGGFELVSYSFLARSVYSMLLELYHTILLYYDAETKEMIYESVNLKGDVYESKQNSSSLQSIKFIH